MKMKIYANREKILRLTLPVYAGLFFLMILGYFLNIRPFLFPFLILFFLIMVFLTDITKEMEKYEIEKVLEKPLILFLLSSADFWDFLAMICTIVLLSMLPAFLFKIPLFLLTIAIAVVISIIINRIFKDYFRIFFLKKLDD